MTGIGRLGAGLWLGWLPALALFFVQGASHETRGTSEKQVDERIFGVHVPFIANAGQINPAVAYYAPTFAGTTFVTRDGRIVYSLSGRRSPASGRRSPDRTSAWSLTESVVGGRAHPIGGDRASTRVSYFLGNDPARWRSGVQTFESVSLGEVWPGIEIELRAQGKSLEKVFTVRPGADSSRIRMSVAGALRLRADRSGALIASTGPGDVTLTPPAAYQEDHGARRDVPVAYEARGREYGFRLGGYDPALAVVIDPLLQATYLGGSGDEFAIGLAIHPTSGEVYVAGQTDSANFPGTTGGAQAANDGIWDVFVARLNATLTTVDQATYLGGSSTDQPLAVAIHPTSGDVYVAGFTSSTDFPGTSGGAQATSALGNNHGFVARLNAALTTLVQATYLGGSGSDLAYALAIHPTSGEVYVAGGTTSNDFPGTTGGAQAAISGGGDAFVARVNAALTTLGQATYLGGTGNETAQALAIHPTSGDVYVAGGTNSTDLPGRTGGPQPGYGGGASDAFVARLNADLTTLDQTTYLGGSANEYGQALAIHPTSGEVYVAGITNSADFPGTTGGAQAPFGSVIDAFVARLNADLTTLDQATYLGGSDYDYGNALAIHPTSGDVYVAGFTTSANFPGTTGGAQAANAGARDAFVARLNADLTTLGQATYLGGSSDDQAQALAIHPTSGDVYLAGASSSADFPGTAGGAQAAYAGGGQDALVARLTANLAAGPTPTVTGIAPNSGPASGGTTITITGTGFVASAVKIGGVAATDVAFVGTTSITCKTPALPAGTLDDVEVTNPGPASATLPKAWFADFLDVPQSHPFHNAIEAIVRAGITTGCGGGNYCPDDAVTRDAMAKFLLVAKHGASFSPPPATGNVFCDVTVSTLLAKWMEELEAEGITSGCASGGCGKPDYCPMGVVTRDEMAKFLLLAKNGSSFSPPPATGNVFCDVTTGTFLAKWMEEMKAEGITSGCGSGACGKPDYCPTKAVTRAEMAKFLKIAFKL